MWYIKRTRWGMRPQFLDVYKRWVCRPRRTWLPRAKRQLGRLMAFETQSYAMLYADRVRAGLVVPLNPMDEVSIANMAKTYDKRK